MTLHELVKKVQDLYSAKAIARTRYSALEKVVSFLSSQEKGGQSAMELLENTPKDHLKVMYLRYKINVLCLSDSISGAENQAINDLYNNLHSELNSKTKITKMSYISSTDKITELKGINLSDTKKGLPPMVGDAPRVLILGTLPGDVSIQEQAYYRNVARNKFWEIMKRMFPEDSDLSNEILLKTHHIALWDCLREGSREGSEDLGFDTKSLVPNDLESFLESHPSIRVIVLNGKGGSKKSTSGIFNQFFGHLKKKYRVIALPSTSNANPVSFDEKLRQWSDIKQYVD